MIKNLYSFSKGKYNCIANGQVEAQNIIMDEVERVNKLGKNMSSLLVKNGEAYKNFEDNLSPDNLNLYFYDSDSLIYNKMDNTSAIKGEVVQREIDNCGKIKYNLAYRYDKTKDIDFRAAHEMGHLMLNPNNSAKFKYDEQTNSYQVSGLIRKDATTNRYYGTQIQENAINLIAQLGIREEKGVNADDIITGKVDLTEENSYKQQDNLVKMLAMSMRNDYEIEYDFETMVKEGKLDGMLEYPDGKEEPVNTFFYAMVNNDSSIIEKEVDKYIGKGGWKDICTAFDSMYEMDRNSREYKDVYKLCSELIQDFASQRIADKFLEAQSRNQGIQLPSPQNKMNLIKNIAEPNRNIQNRNISDYSI